MARKVAFWLLTAGFFGVGGILMYYTLTDNPATIMFMLPVAVVYVFVGLWLEGEDANGTGIH
jgi:hypothetical protein